MIIKKGVIIKILSFCYSKHREEIFDLNNDMVF